jgi:hypothetical protein
MSTFVPTTRTTKFCPSCGYVLDVDASTCPKCRRSQPALATLSRSERRLLPASLLCVFLGIFGAHRFYAGKTGTGLIQLVTLGGAGLWWMGDLIMLLTGSFRDADGERITRWT